MVASEHTAVTTLLPAFYGGWRTCPSARLSTL